MGDETKKRLTVCPECSGRIFKEDSTHAETYCYKCGVVLVAPMEYTIHPDIRVVFPGVKRIKTKKKRS